MPRNISHRLLTLAIISACVSLFSAEKKGIIIQEITAVEEPFFTTFHGENLIVSSLQEAHLVDWKNNKKIRTIFENKKGMFSCLFSKNKNLIAATGSRNVHLYDQEGKKKWQIIRAPTLPSCTFTARNVLYELGSGKLQNSNSEIVTTIPGKDVEWYGPITSHPTREQIFYTEYISENESALCTINITGNYIDFDKKELPKFSHPNHFNNMPYAQAHSFTNDIIALNYVFSKQWNLYNSTNNTFMEERLADGLCCNVAFHPTTSLMAILKYNGFVEIYDFINKKIISQTTQSLGPIEPESSIIQNAMNFSENGYHLAIVTTTKIEGKQYAYKNQCFVLSNLY